MDFVEACKIEIAAIHNVDGAGFDDQVVEDIDVVNLSCCYDDHRRNVSVQIQEGMEFYGTFPFSKSRTWEKGQTAIDGSRVQGVNCLIQFDPKGIFDIKFSGPGNEYLSEIGINSPISGLIGMGKGIARHLPPDAQMIKPGRGYPQAGLNISQAFPVGELSKRHAKILVPAGKADHFVIAVVSIDAFSELVCGDKVH